MVLENHVVLRVTEPDFGKKNVCPKGYSGILIHIHLHLQERSYGREGVLIFGRKALIFSDLSLNFRFKMQLQEHLGEKLQMFSCWASFSGVFDEIFIEMPFFHKLPPRLALKSFWFCSCTTVILCYVLHQTFRILAYSTLYFFRFMPLYSIIFSVTEAYSRILRY